jgi:hypothetical protein
MHTRNSIKLLVLAAAFAASAFLVRWMLARPAARDTKVVGMRGELEALLRRRADPSRAPDPRPGEPGFPPPLLREPLDEHLTGLFFPMSLESGFRPDPVLFYGREPNLRTSLIDGEHPRGGYELVFNSRGLRNAAEPRVEPPDLRLLVAGASNVEGVSTFEETAVHLLENGLKERLPRRSVEALNAGVPGYSFYNDLGVLERHRELAPDVFLLVAYGGNEFFAGVRLYRYFERLGPPVPVRWIPELFEGPENQSLRAFMGVEVGQARYLQVNPLDLDLAVTVACAATVEMERSCAAQNARFLCAYLPPPLQGQPEFHAEDRVRVLARLELTSEDLAVSDRIADAWLGFLRARRIAHLDLRPAIRAARESLYWSGNGHLNLAGQRLLAETLLPFVLEHLPSNKR